MIWRIKRIIQLLLFLYRNFEKIKEVVIDSSLLKNEIQILNQEKRGKKARARTTARESKFSKSNSRGRCFDTS